MDLKLEVIDIPIADGTNVIIGKSHFIKTVEDLYEALVTSCPSIRFGIAFCEASGKRLIRRDGNDEELTELAVNACKKIAAGHVFVIYLRGGWPINVLNAIKNVQEVVSIEAATANPLKVIVADLGEQRALLGVADGFTPLGVEEKDDIEERKEFLRKIGYKR
ncbi:MAG: adenosine-specific kinase [Desulfurococcales archaeon]|nr:adenosine-specific kinase [Desulfurococcales archaeon]MCE4622737.1 adenosine-specific kinase [Desulfurococcales archaeon]MCE4626206.1 adenosine-specific kinase [Desulfurococcales archaeon]MCE4628703.1 adenosine-specific kinase [Desulfurococcales archaeon]